MNLVFLPILVPKIFIRFFSSVGIHLNKGHL